MMWKAAVDCRKVFLYFKAEAISKTIAGADDMHKALGEREISCLFYYGCLLHRKLFPKCGWKQETF